MGILNTIKSALSKTANKVSTAISGKKSGIEFTEAIEEALITADVGATTAQQLAESVAKAKFPTSATEHDVRTFLADKIETLLAPYEEDLFASLHRPEIILIVGVNGNGKTTTIAKIAKMFKERDLEPLLVAADTFRAAAVAQLSHWANEIGVDIHTGNEGSDAAGLIYDALQKTQRGRYDVVLIDTAGRMQNRIDLMDELKKIRRVIGKIYPEAPHKSILILDAVTGQAVHKQVETFQREIKIDGIILTKLDSTAKGGSVVALTQQYRIPIFAVGVGEAPEDIRAFSAREFARALFDL